MAANIYDRRVRKTKKTLIEALTFLMAQKKINHITVTELTEVADVNRSTFYFYYKDVFDMVEQVESELLAGFTKAYNECFEGTASYSDILVFFTFLFEFVHEHAKLCKVLLGPDGDYAFLEKLKAIIKSQPGLENDNRDIKLQYYDPFILSGCIGVIQQWLDHGMQEKPKEMANMIIELLHIELL